MIRGQYFSVLLNTVRDRNTEKGGLRFFGYIENWHVMYIYCYVHIANRLFGRPSRDKNDVITR
jgi:hypothetical protein